MIELQGKDPMQVLVTGGAGYVGSVVSAQLAAAGHDVTVLDNFARGHRDAVPPGIALCDVDLGNADEVTAVLANGALDAVVHLAALSLVGESVADPARYFRGNIGAALNLLDAMRSAGVTRIVFSSTAAVYGQPDGVPITETAPPRPTNPYGASKPAVDQLLGFEAAAHGLAAVSLRYFNVAGASDGRGERHDPETHLIPLVLDVAAGRRESVQVYGTDYATPDGTAVRDYIHVADLAAATCSQWAPPPPAGTTSTTSATGRASPCGRSSRPPSRSPDGRSDDRLGPPGGRPAGSRGVSDRIAADLGWRPRTPELADIISDAWAFARADRSAVRS